MYLYSSMRALAENATGYVGGDYEDGMPELGLNEAASYLPVVCLECQTDLLDLSRENNATLMEAAASAVEYGTPFDPSALTEASMESIKKAITNGFERIKKFIQSVIAKIRNQISVWTKSGEQLWSQYSNSLNGDYSGLTVEGWTFPGTKILDAANKCKVTQLLNNAFGERLPSPDKFEKSVAGMAAAVTRGGAEKKNSSLKDMSQGERDKNLAMALTGVKGLGDDWRNDLTKQVWGERKEIKYGEGMFTKEGVGTLLKNAGGNLKAIETEYVNLEKEVSDLEKSVIASSDRAAAALSKAKSDNDAKGTANYGLISDYYSNYASYVHQAVSVISYVKQVAIRFQKERYALAKTMLGKMITNKGGKKKENEEFDGDEYIEGFDFEL